MMNSGRRIFGKVLLGAAMGMAALVIATAPAGALEVGEVAPDFKMPATTGADIALSDYKGKKWVFLEFYGADFQPT
jgi:hypothetical protein